MLFVQSILMDLLDDPWFNPFFSMKYDPFLRTRRIFELCYSEDGSEHAYTTDNPKEALDRYVDMTASGKHPAIHVTYSPAKLEISETELLDYVKSLEITDRVSRQSLDNVEKLLKKIHE